MWFLYFVSKNNCPPSVLLSWTDSIYLVSFAGWYNVAGWYNGSAGWLVES